MSNEQIDELLALEARATPGPWEAEEVMHGTSSYGIEGVRTIDRDGYQVGGNWYSRTVCQTLYNLRVDETSPQADNMRFIAAARNSIRELAEEVKRLRAALEVILNLSLPTGHDLSADIARIAREALEAR